MDTPEDDDLDAELNNNSEKKTKSKHNDLINDAVMQTFSISRQLSVITLIVIVIYYVN